MTLRNHSLLLMFILLTVLNACSTPPYKPVIESTPEQLAEKAYAAGDYGRAAEYWQQAGSSAATGNIDSLRVKTADAWLRGQRPGQAAELLLQVNRDALRQRDLALFYLAYADLALQQRDPGLAEFYLEAAAQNLAAELQTRFSDLQALRNAMQRDPNDRRLAEAIELSNNMSGYQPDVALEILRSLESIPSGQMMAMIDGQQYEPDFTEWLKLSLQIRTSLINGDSISVAVEQWTQQNTAHVFNPENFPDLIYRYRSLFPTPSRVAILLPATGSLAAASKAIRDGIMSAYLEQPGHSVIRFYSSGQNSTTAIAAYRRALADGANQIIGPLRIESTRALSSLDTPGVPILLLNQAADKEIINPARTDVVHSLSLSQTEEPIAIAIKALEQGQNHAIVIVPDNNWGTRIEAAFASIFEKGEGKISDTARFNIATGDHSAMLTQLLKIDESTQRKTDLQSRLGIPLTFEPSRRDDFDFIFMAASPSQGRELKPLLRFHDTGDVPVYAMGRIFSGKTERASDRDLDGIVFPTIPLQLQETDDTTLKLESMRGGAFANLYALGRDAWHLLPWLPLMQKDTDLWFPGDVGSLRLQEDGNLYRQPAWARFSAGLPAPYQWPDHH